MKNIKITMTFLIDESTKDGKKFFEDVTDKVSKNFRDEYEDGHPLEGITPLTFNYLLVED